jgi:hypothetical protein
MRIAVGFAMVTAVTVLAGCTSPTAPDTIDITDLMSVLRNSCSSSIELKFFDRTNGDAWPKQSPVWVLDSDQQNSYELKCRKQAQICFGAKSPFESEFESWANGDERLHRWSSTS